MAKPRKAKPKRQWGKLKKSTRDRFARLGSKFGLSRKQTRERYNRGTYNPGSRDPVKQIPKNAPRIPGASREELEEAATRKFDRSFGDRFKYNRFTILDAIHNHATDDALRRMAGASADELETWASFQPSKKDESKPESKTPYWLKHLGWFGDDGKWHNVFWYH